MSVLQQAGCVPLRGEGATLEVLLVTSRYTGAWIVPKGTIEPGEDPAETAAREAEEEAGVRGEIGPLLGTFDYPRAHKTGRVTTYLLRVTEELADWPERRERRRKWFPLELARQVVQRTEVLAMLEALAESGVA